MALVTSCVTSGNGGLKWHSSMTRFIVYLEGVALVLMTVCSLQGCPLRPGLVFWLTIRLIYLLNKLLVFSTVFLICILYPWVTPRMAVGWLVLGEKGCGPSGMLKCVCGSALCSTHYLIRYLR